MADKCDVVIIVPPFSSILSPAFGPSILCQSCRHSDLITRVYYANIDYWELIGNDTYNQINSLPNEYLIGEGIFSSFAFDSFPNQQKAQTKAYRLLNLFSCNILYHNNINASSIKMHVDICIRNINRFINFVVDNILSMSPSIIGFSSLFQQTMASIALARRIKEVSPNTITVLGGSNSEHPMGKAIADITPMFDYIFSGEADFDFPEFCKTYLLGQRTVGDKVINCAPITNLNKVPIPCYDDYFARIGLLPLELNLQHRLPNNLPFEASRGCWWGMKKHCTFCGLNARGMAYRSKTPSRIIEELMFLTEKYNIKQISAVDNIMPLEFQKAVIPNIKKLGKNYKFFFEVKANLESKVLDKFVQSGISSIQPGIESLSDNMLRKLQKGTTCFKNISLLRDCLSRQISVHWNYITEIPNACKSDYESISKIIPLLIHLPPPIGYRRIRVDRYSPYFENPRAFGIKKLLPYPAYGLIFPDKCDSYSLSYHFTYKRKKEMTELSRWTRNLIMSLKKWKDSWSRTNCPVLRVLQIDHKNLIIEDTRDCAVERFTPISENEWSMLELLNKERKISQFSGLEQKVIEKLISRRFVLFFQDKLINLVTDPRLGIKLRKQMYGIPRLS